VTVSFGALVGLVAFVGFAALIMLVRFSIQREQRALLARARAFACLSCGKPLGDEAVAQADALWEQHMQRLLSREPVKHRVVRNLDAVCPHCGKRYQLDATTSTFAPLDVVLSFERG
jgi:transcription elongation factor Elf1